MPLHGGGNTPELLLFPEVSSLMAAMIADAFLTAAWFLNVAESGDEEPHGGRITGVPVLNCNATVGRGTLSNPSFGK